MDLKAFHIELNSLYPSFISQTTCELYDLFTLHKADPLTLKELCNFMVFYYHYA